MFKQLVAAGSINELRQLAPQTVTNNTAIFVNSPIFTELQSMLIERLAPHPTALAAVIDAAACR